MSPIHLLIAHHILLPLAAVVVAETLAEAEVQAAF
jgi:hypothetical protein